MVHITLVAALFWASRLISKYQEYINYVYDQISQYEISALEEFNDRAFIIWKLPVYVIRNIKQSSQKPPGKKILK